MTANAEPRVRFATLAGGQARFVVGDTLTVLRAMPAGSVDLILSSPPFLALRSYLPPDHPDKALEIGSEATPGEYLDTLLDVVEECRRVLAPHGSLCFELGDTYAGSGGSGGDYGEGGLREGQARQAKWQGTAHVARTTLANGETSHSPWRGERPGWPLDKSLCLIPESFRWALAYGHNPFTGRSTPRWRVRNVIRWCRPNPPVGALGDKMRPATSEMVVACTDRRRYFDLDAVRTVGTEPGAVKRHSTAHHNPSQGWSANSAAIHQNPAGAPPLDWWEPLPEEAEAWDAWERELWIIPTAPFTGRHYATWPPTLCVRPIKAMSPERVCTVCGRPSERITEVAHKANRSTNGPQSIERRHREGGSPGFAVRADTEVRTLGWTDCGCPGGSDRWRAGVVLDPFVGSGTTLAVAVGHGRAAIGIDLDPRNVDLAYGRLGMLLEVGSVMLDPSTPQGGPDPDCLRGRDPLTGTSAGIAP